MHLYDRVQKLWHRYLHDCPICMGKLFSISRQPSTPDLITLTSGHSLQNRQHALQPRMRNGKNLSLQLSRQPT